MESALAPQPIEVDEIDPSDGKNADHADDAYTSVLGNFRYLAPTHVEEQELIGEG